MGVRYTRDDYLDDEAVPTPAWARDLDTYRLVMGCGGIELAEHLVRELLARTQLELAMVDGQTEIPDGLTRDMLYEAGLRVSKAADIVVEGMRRAYRHGR